METTITANPCSNHTIATDQDKITKSIGSIECLMGCMWSGKSSTLLCRIERYEVAGKKCLLVKYRKDTRYSQDCIVTHNGRKVFALPSVSLMEEVLPFIHEYDVIGIDEGQFFSQLVEFCQCAVKQGKIVIIAVLDSDFRRKPFTGPEFADTPALFAMADTKVQLKAVCMRCKGDASFTHKFSGSKQPTGDIGGKEKYMAVCGPCYHALNTLSPVQSSHPLSS